MVGRTIGFGNWLSEPVRTVKKSEKELADTADEQEEEVAESSTTNPVRNCQIDPPYLTLTTT